MADYIYLLENRLSPAQQRALSNIRNIVRGRELTLFLTGGAVRDLTGGGSVRDLDVTVQGAVSSLRGDFEAAGAVFDGENPQAQALFFTFPGGVRVEVASAMAVTYSKPGKPKYEPASILEDLRRRDFTANAMGLSLNEGSYGLLMDPLNGVADIEHRELRLVSNYGFIEDPSLMLRAVRLSARLGLQMDERTRQRFDNAKGDDAIANLAKFNGAYELEEIFHEEDPMRIMRALDGEGLLKTLSPSLVGLKPNDAALAELRDKQGQLQTQGILSNASALAFPLILGKLPQKDADTLRSTFARPGFAGQMNGLEEKTRELQTRFAGRDAGTPSVAWRMLHEAEPNLVLSMFFTAKNGTVQARMKTFLTESPTARQRLPYAVLQEMRIVPDLPIYAELLDKLFFELMDGKLGTIEELKAYLEPYSPPAPPAPINLRRARAKKEARPSRAKAKKAALTVVAQEEAIGVAQEEAIGVAQSLMEPGTLTGADHGTEPTVTQPLEGKVAPLATGEAEPLQAKVKRPARKPAVPVVPDMQAAAEPAAVAKKLSAKPAPMPKKDAEAVMPHPEAAKEIAAKKAPAMPVAKAVAATSGKTSEASLASKQSKVAKTVAPSQPAVTAKKEVAALKVAAHKKAVPARKEVAAALTVPVPAKKSAAAPAKKASPAKVFKVASTKAAAKTAAKGKPPVPQKTPKPAEKAPAKKVVAPATKTATKVAAKTTVNKAVTPLKTSTQSKPATNSKPAKKTGR